MSLMRCRNCGEIVDTDAAPESFVPHGKDKYGIEEFICLCIDCRDRFETEE